MHLAHEKQKEDKKPNPMKFVDPRSGINCFFNYPGDNGCPPYGCEPHPFIVELNSRQRVFLGAGRIDLVARERLFLGAIVRNEKYT